MTSTNTVSILNWRDERWTRALRNWIGSAAAVIARFKALAPYALIELVLPGGSVVALLLWLYRRQMKGAAGLYTSLFGLACGSVRPSRVGRPQGAATTVPRALPCRARCITPHRHKVSNTGA